MPSRKQPPFKAVSGHDVRVSLQNFLVVVDTVDVVIVVVVSVVVVELVTVVSVAVVDVDAVVDICGGAVLLVRQNLASFSILRSPPPQTQHASFAFMPSLLLVFTPP